MDEISVTEAAKLLKISRRRVNALIAAGRLPARKIGSYYAIRKRDLAKVKDRKPGRPRKQNGTPRNRSSRTPRHP
jgi:excisionase family DNA binding protein